jgi:uncharacterized protein YjbI with pentapeptide repeats
VGRSGSIAALLALLAAQTGCKEDPALASLTRPERPFLYEADFARTPNLAALPDQVVVIDLEPTNAAQATAEDLSRHELQAGAHRFCIEKGDPSFEHLRLEDGEGRAVVDLDASAECADVHLEAGTYLLRLRHRGAGIGSANQVGFFRRLSSGFSPLRDGGVPLPGWWALAPDDPTGKERQGRLHALPPPRTICDGGTCYLPGLPIVADFSSRQIDDTALFDFSHLGGEGVGGPYLIPGIRSGPYPLDLTWDLPGSSVLIAVSDGVVHIGNKFLASALKIVDLGNGKVQLQEFEIFYALKYVPFFIDTDNVVKWADKPPQLPYMNEQVLFRVLFPGDPDYAQAAPAEGEVALYQGCNYSGPVTMFSVSTPDLSAFTSPSITLDRTTASVKNGPNVAMTLFSEAGYGGTQFGSTIDQPCLDETPIGRNTRSVRLTPALQVFIATHSCEGCNLSGLDLTGVDGSGAFLLNANLSGATLDRTILHAARSLSGTIFSGATITCSDFSGTDGGLVDLTQTELSSADFNADISSCRSNFSNTKVDVSRIKPAALPLLDLTQATILLSSTPPLENLSGVLWPRTTLQGGSLQGVHFGNAVLQGATLSGVDLRAAVFAGANLTGATFTGARIDGSNLQDAGFTGTTFIDVSGFQTAVVQGVNFSGATFGGTGFVQASLEQVILDGAIFRPGSDFSEARFNDSSMQGVDLHGVQLYGANFTHTNLQNSNLTGALLSNNPDAGVEIPADFTGAHLKNVNLSSAQLQGTVFHFASIYGSFNINNGPPALSCETDTTKCRDTPVTGFTCSCATAVGASMTRTDFSNAFLYGVDFKDSGTVINGVDFSGAILVGASFHGAKFQVDPSQGGAQPRFGGAFLQGTDLGTASLDSTSFLNAYVDFEPGGNQLQIVLGPNYTSWNGWEAPEQPVCVQVDYSGFVTQVPVTTGNTECPDGLQHPGGCGSTPPRPNPNPNWKSPIAIDQASPPGFYSYNATYTEGNQDAGCNSNTANFDW